MNKQTIAIDLDGVLNNYAKFDKNNIPEIKDGAKEFIVKLSKDYQLILFTNRNPKLATEWLIKNKLNNYFDEVTNVKPIASIYLLELLASSKLCIPLLKIKEFQSLQQFFATDGLTTG